MPIPTNRQVKKEGKTRRARGPRHLEQDAPAARQSWASRSEVLAAAALIVLSVAVYAPAIGHPFANLDDLPYVTGNPHVMSGLRWDTVQWSFADTSTGNWHPLTWMSHATDVLLFGQAPWGHHLTNIALHAANAVLLFFFLANATGMTRKSLIVAALFALHPMNVENVAWVAERKSLLSTLWFFAALWAYVAYSRRPNWKRYMAVAGFFLLGLASKPMVVTLPVVALLLDYWPLERVPKGVWLSGKLMLEKLPLLVLSAADSLLAILAQRSAGAVSSIDTVSLGLRLQNALRSYALYVGKIVWPARLAILYPFPRTIPAWQAAAAAVFLAALTTLAIRSRRPYLWTGWFWFLLTLLPVIGIIQVGAQSMADRYVYIPAVGLFWMAVWGMEEIAEWMNIGLRTSMILAVAPLIVLALVTLRQLSYWQTNERLWRHAVSVTEDNYYAEDKLGNELYRLGRLEEGYQHYESALRINPSDPMSNFIVGAHMQVHGMLGPALAHYETTVGKSTDPVLSAQAYANMGAAYRQLGDNVRAADSYRKALQYDWQTDQIHEALKQMGSEPESR